MNKAIGIITSILLVCGCVKISKTNKGLTENIDTAGMVSWGADIIYLHPSPKELVDIVENSGIVFDESLLHKQSTATEYVGTQSINLNLGVYIADLAYCGLFDQNSLANSTFEAISYLSRYIYISSSLKTELKGLISSRKNNFSSRDIQSEIIYYKLVNDLESTYQHNTVALVSAGAYIESLYLTLNSLAALEKNHDINLGLGNQQFAFRNLLSYIQDIDVDKKLIYIETKLEEILKIYDDMKVVDLPVKSSKGSGSQIHISGGLSYYMDKDSFNKMNSLVNGIREEIILSVPE